MTRREQIVKQIEKVSKVYLPEGTKVFIFGSQANRAELRNSDIDIGVVPTQVLPLRELWEFKEALNATPNLYTFDVVDFNQAEDSFKAVAMRDIEIVING